MGRTPLSKSKVNADVTVKLCPYCRRCWEQNKIVFRIGQKAKIIYYDDFPSYGKQKEICVECEEKIHSCDLCLMERDDVVKQGFSWVCTDCDMGKPENIMKLPHPNEV